MDKKNSAAKANAKPLTKKEYIAIRNTLQEKSHRAKLLDWLWTHGSITSMEAFDRLHNTRIGATIFDLRDMGVPIKTTMVTKKRHGEVIRYGIYSIERRGK